ncbi:MAG: hypothetical protein AB7H66_05450 [Hyphomonadaceae bacterium]
MNYTPPPPLPSETRLARLVTWLALTVACFAAHVLTLIAPHTAKRQLAKYARWSWIVLVARALKRLRPPRRQRRRTVHALTPSRYPTLRRIAGVKLRRALRGRTPIERARAIYAVLTNPEPWIAHLMRRICRRLTRLRALPRPAAADERALALADVCAALSPAPQFHDSS